MDGTFASYFSSITSRYESNNPHKRYNETLEYIHKQEELGNVFVIRPSITIAVGRVERNRERLERLYELGWNDAKEQFDGIKRFLV